MNEGLRSVWQEFHPVLTDVLQRLDGTEVGRVFKRRALEVAAIRAFHSAFDKREALAAYRWFLEQAAGDGMALTQAGFLRPATVRAAAEVLPTMRDWDSAMTREMDVHPVLDFRERLQEIGLLRRYKGTLRQTRAGRLLLDEPEELWRLLAGSIVVGGSVDEQHLSVVLLVIAASGEGPVDFDAVAETMSALGWRRTDGEPFRKYDFHPIWLWQCEVLRNVVEEEQESVDDEARPSLWRAEAKLGDVAKVLVADALSSEVDAETVAAELAGD